MAVSPLAVWLGVKLPHGGAMFAVMGHVTTQSTPAPAGSLETMADTTALLPVIIVGGACVISTEIRGVWEIGLAWLVLLHPAMKPMVVKLLKTARNAAIQSFRRPFPSVLP